MNRYSAFKKTEKMEEEAAKQSYANFNKLKGNDQVLFAIDTVTSAFQYFQSVANNMQFSLIDMVNEMESFDKAFGLSEVQKAFLKRLRQVEKLMETMEQEDNKHVETMENEVKNYFLDVEQAADKTKQAVKAAKKQAKAAKKQVKEGKEGGAKVDLQAVVDQSKSKKKKVKA